MDAHALAVLEYDKVLAQVARHCAFSGGATRVRALTPSTDWPTIESGLTLTEEAYAYLAHQTEPSFGGVIDMTELMRRAQRRVRLQTGELRDIRRVLERTHALRRAFTRHAALYPALAELAGFLQPCPALAAAIGRCISERAEVLDRASPALHRIRAALRTEQDRLSGLLTRLASHPDLKPYLQEAIVTQRQGRYVVPVRTEHKGKLPGIVHDQSASGATTFIEPLAVVDQNNAVRALELEEDKEVRRILTRLTEAVAEAQPELEITMATLSDLDCALAKAKYAYAIKGVRPEMDARAPGTTIWLRQARHPLLAPDQAVPLDLEMGPEPGPTGSAPCHMTLITGPNTGGKTVALKTVGLLALMAQSGLLIPAGSGSRLSRFAGVYADIGDEQSIEQNLSTFSGHLTHIVAILDQAASDSLVILDEVGAGTDPEEGSALAIALLEHLRARGVTTLASTHYSELKAYAHAAAGVSNAAMEFDVETLRPTFRLQMGLPGRSNALAIARRLGLAADVVALAETRVKADASAANAMLDDIRGARQRALEAQAAAQEEKELAQLMRSELSYRLSQVEADRQAVIADAQAAMARQLDAARQEWQALRRQVAAAIWDQPRTAQLRQLDAAQARLERQAAEQAASSAPPAAPAPAPPPGAIERGDTVWIASLQATGQVSSEPDPGQAVEVQAGHIRLKVRLADLELRRKAAPEKARVRYSLASRDKVSLELDIRGERVDPGVAQVDQYLHEAFLSRVPWVRIIHGKGTGQLRTAVRALVQRHPHVARSRAGDAAEGGEGVTIATFAYD